MSQRRMGLVVGLVVLSLLGTPGGAVGEASGAPDEVIPADQAEAAGGSGSAVAGRIAAGGSITCAVLDNGAVRCWGAGRSGQLGYGNTENIGDDETPTSVGPVDLGVGRTAVAVSAGASHACSLLDDGSVRCWGSGFDGQLGYGNVADVGDDETPGSVGPVDLGAGRSAVAISTGGNHVCALLDDATVRCWGNGGDAAGPSGMLGYGNPDDIGDDESPGSVGPVDLGAGRTAVAISAGGAHTCAILDDGSVRCWGAGEVGALGYGNTSDIGDDETPGSVGPVDLGAGRTAVAISTGSNHTCAVLDDDTLRCWGLGTIGRLGYGNTTTIGDDETPGSVGPVDLGAGRTAVAISAGDQHTCAVLDDGSVRCWGEAFAGQLGYGNPNDIGDNETPGSVGPVDLGVGRTAVAVAAGGGHSCAVLDDATLRCWGRGDWGQLGYGNPNKVGNPRSVGPIDVGGVVSAVSPASLSRVHVSNRTASGGADYVFLLGRPVRPAVVGDWDGNGADGFATRLGNTYSLVDERGAPYARVGYGKGGDDVFIGDWDGDGTDGIGVRRGNVFFLRDSPTTGVASRLLGYGRAGDEVFVGDWDGDGRDTFAVRRGNVFYIRNSTTSGPAEVLVGYGVAGDEVLVGDWDGDGADTLAVRRDKLIFIRNQLRSGPAESIVSYGLVTDEVLVGDFDGDGVDTFAARRA